MEEPIVTLTGNSFAKQEGISLVSQVTSYFKSIGGQANTAFGTVILDKKGVKNDNSHPNYLNKTIAYEAIKDVLEKGSVSLPFDYHKVHEKSQPTGKISGTISINGTLFRCDVMVIGNKDGKIRLYLHDVYQIEKPQQNILTKHVLDSPEQATSRHSAEDGAKVQQNIETTKDNNIKTENKQYKTNRNMKRRVRLNESDLHRIMKESVNKALREGINDITPLSTHIQNNQDMDLETLGNIVDDLRKVKEGGALSKWNPTIAARLRKSGLVDTETVQAITQINLLIYRLGNMDFSHKRVYNGETFDDTRNRLQHEQD